METICKNAFKLCRFSFKIYSNLYNKGPPTKYANLYRAPLQLIFNSWITNSKRTRINVYKKYMNYGNTIKYSKPSYSKGLTQATLLSISIPFLGKKSEEEKEGEVISIMKHAILASQRGDFAKAEQLLHVALKAAQESNDQNAVTYIYDLMANLALQKEDFKKAEKLFVEVLKRFLQGDMSPDHNAVVDVSLKLASIYSNLGDNEKACEGFQFCIGTQEAKLKEKGEENVDEDTLVLWAMSHDWFARFLLNLGHYARAKDHFTRAYDVCVKVKGEDDPQSAVLLNDLGSVSSLQQKYDDAINFMNKAIEIGRKVESEDLASFYVNLGTVYMQKKVFENAEENCKIGMKIAKAYKNEEALKESKTCLETLRELKK